jgi:hypothetical protein
MTSAADAVRVASGSGACARCSVTPAIAFPGLGAPTGRDSPSPGRRFVAPAAQDRPLVHVVHADLASRDKSTRRAMHEAARIDCRK